MSAAPDFRPGGASACLLEACFAPGERAAGACRTWREQADLDTLDPALAALLPLLCRRWNGPPLDADLEGFAQRVHLSAWSSNRERLAVASRLAVSLADAGIQPVFLKGIALLAGGYPDIGLRAMTDIDLLVAPAEAAGAVQALVSEGWIPERGLAPGSLTTRMRVGHAWQFKRGGHMCDLHWHPLVRCYSPRIGECFRSHAVTARAGDYTLRVPSPTDQLFHVVVHGLQWSWSAPIRWVADAMAVLGSPVGVDWERLAEMAAEAHMTVRVFEALSYLRGAFGAAVPEAALHALSRTRVPRWERRDFRLMLKPCPLGIGDSLRWHLGNFRRLRPHDPAWRGKNALVAFGEYLGAFLRVNSRSGLAAELRSRAAGRLKPGRRGKPVRAA